MKLQVVCLESGKSRYVEPDYKPLADELRATCPDGCMCGAAEYREEGEV